MNRIQTRQLRKLYKHQGVQIMPGGKAEFQIAEVYVRECIANRKDFDEAEFIRRLKNAKG